MTARAERANRKRVERDIRDMLRRQDREKLRELRALIRRARVRRREALAAVRVSCARARKRITERARAARKQALAAIRQAVELERQAAKQTCAKKRARARGAAQSVIDKAARELERERADQRLARSAERRGAKLAKPRSSAAERRQESDDAVRANLPDDLVPVFDAVRHRIKASARKSRTEAFLQWAEENPGEVVRIQGDQADADVRELMRQEAEHYRQMRRANRYRRSAAAMAEDLEDVPF